MSGQASALGGCVLVEDVSDLLGWQVGDFDADMRLICREGLSESFFLTWGELVARGVQKKPDLVEGIALVSAVTQGVLLDATAYFIKGVTGELDDVKGIEDAGCVLELIVDGVLAVPGRDPASRFAPLHGSLLRARPTSSCTRCQTFPGPGPTSGPWDDPPRVSGPRCR